MLNLNDDAPLTQRAHPRMACYTTANGKKSYRCITAVPLRWQLLAKACGQIDTAPDGSGRVKSKPETDHEGRLPEKQSVCRSSRPCELTEGERNNMIVRSPRG